MSRIVESLICGAFVVSCGDGGGPDGMNGDAAMAEDGTAPPRRGDGSTDAARDRFDGAEVPATVGACEVTSAFELVGGDTDTYPIDVAVRGREIGLLYVAESPRRMVFGSSTLDEPEIASPETLGETPVLNQAGIVPFESGFAIAWTDFTEEPVGRVRIARTLGGTVVSDVRIGGEWIASGAIPGRTSSGRLAVLWGEQLPPVEQYELRVALSDDAETFDPHAVIAAGMARPSVVSAVTTDDSMAVTWVDRVNSPNLSTLRFASVLDDGTITAPRTIVEHDRYIYETSLAYGYERLLLATTDSRADILTVPMYLTVLEPDGTTVEEGIRLTTDDHQEHVGIAFGANAFGLVSVPFIDMASSNEQQVFFRQTSADGETLTDPQQVSAASIPESDCCIRANHARITAIEPALYLVVWAEHAQRPDRPVFVVRGAIVNCKP
ncbi:MAG: hypothetical protein IT350_02135 [Deltaproteobacteria bacterium]|nr:hypothetical protein [Deltaproteobacteria bacterium]